MFRQLVILSFILVYSFNSWSATDPVTTADCFNKTRHCMAVIDAGSSGSRLHVYAYTLKNKTPHDIQEVWVKTQSPGLASIPNDMNSVKTYLHGLLNDFPVSGSAQNVKKIPLYFYGTAGMRLLPTQNQMYDKVKVQLRKNYLIWNLKDARTITGTEEGVNGWIAMNYHLGLIQSDDQKEFSYAGFMDMGGASVQIAMPVAEENFQENNPDFIKLNLYGRDHRLFVHSFLGLGQTQVTNQFMEKSRCYPHGYPMVNKQQGAGDATLCEENVSRLINNVHDVDSLVKPIMQNNTVTTWFATGSIAYNAKNKLYGFTDGFTNKALIEKNADICTADWAALSADQPDNAFLNGYCLYASYYYALMVKGYGFNPEQKINFTKGSLEWTIGVVLQTAGKSVV